MTVSSRSGRGVIKEAGGRLPRREPCAACTDTEGLEPVCLVWKWTAVEPTGLAPERSDVLP